MCIWIICSRFTSLHRRRAKPPNLSFALYRNDSSCIKSTSCLIESTLLIYQTGFSWSLIDSYRIDFQFVLKRLNSLCPVARSQGGHVAYSSFDPKVNSLTGQFRLQIILPTARFAQKSFHQQGFFYPQIVSPTGWFALKSFRLPVSFAFKSFRIQVCFASGTSRIQVSFTDKSSWIQVCFANGSSQVQICFAYGSVHLKVNFPTGQFLL